MSFTNAEKVLEKRNGFMKLEGQLSKMVQDLNKYSPKTCKKLWKLKRRGGEMKVIK